MFLRYSSESSAVKSDRSGFKLWPLLVLVYVILDRFFKVSEILSLSVVK